MARPKRTMAAAAQAGAALTRTAEVKKAEEVKKAAEPVVKEEVKETAAAVKEVAKPEIEKSVVVEFGGRQVAAKDVLAQAEKEYAMNRNQVHRAVHITGAECSLLCGKRRGFRRFQNPTVECKNDLMYE